MSHVYCDVHLHIVWRTKFSRRILEGALENFVHRRLCEISPEFGVDLLAVNSAWDHIHTLFRWNTALAIGDVMKHLKGRTSTEWNELIRSTGIDTPPLYWQRGYGVLSVGSNIDRVVAYIDNQKVHHAANTTYPPFERTGPTNIGKPSKIKPPNRDVG